MPITDLKLTVASGKTKHTNKILPYHARKVQGLSNSLQSLQSCKSNNTVKMDGGQLSSMGPPLLKGMEGTATQCNPGVGHEPALGGTSFPIVCVVLALDS